MGTPFTFKKLIIPTSFVTVVVIAFFTYALAGLNARPVVFATTPSFVEQYAVKVHHSLRLSSQKHTEKPGTEPDKFESEKITAVYSDEKALMLDVFFNDQPPGKLLELFAHQQKAQRVKMALAFSAVNIEFTHNEESGFAKKRDQFWLDAEKHVPDILNALFEALILSAKEGTTTHIPYTLAWMPGSHEKKVKVFAWAAEHHPDPWVRNFSVYYVVELGLNEELAVKLLHSRIHDPDYGVRKEVLDQRFRRFTTTKA